MSIPSNLINRIYEHYQAQDWCLIMLDGDDRVIQCNHHAADLFGLDAQDIDIRDAMPLLATETLQQEFMIPFYNHQDKVFDVHFFLQDEHKYLVLVPVDQMHQQVQHKQQFAHEQVIEKMRLAALFQTLQDAHEELQQANSAKSFYISALSHEIGNPLNAIKGYNQLLSEQQIEADQATAVIDKNVDKIQHIITQTLDYDQQQKSQHLVALRPAEMVDELFHDFKVQAESKSLHLINQVDHSLLINTNPTKWNQILTNLISNAIKYTEQGQVTVSSKTEDELLHIDVADTGCGMSQAFQQQLFTAWSREEKSEAKGNGIGLMISKMLAEQIGADLILHSSDETGSRFRFSIKYIQAKSILLVDDDADCLQLFAYYLSEVGHQITTATSIEELQQRISEQNFDVIITDLNLSDGTVSQIFNSIQNACHQAVVMTANPSQESITSLLQLGFDDVLSKPLNQQQLVMCVS